ncbi:hypothetical protein TNCV_3051521 [Trichonephila clavipes]|nr:hypothetical protein TNCV_3051521 [Trichonephila clavipes]
MKTRRAECRSTTLANQRLLGVKEAQPVGLKSSLESSKKTVPDDVRYINLEKKYRRCRLGSTKARENKIPICTACNVPLGPDTGKPTPLLGGNSLGTAVRFILFSLQCIRRSQTVGNRFNSCQVIYSQFGLAIHQNDHQARRRFVEWAQNEIAVVPDFHKRILFSDEAHFWLNGYVNKQNCRIWSEANPQVYVETPLHPGKMTVWCALLAGGILL